MNWKFGSFAMAALACAVTPVVHADTVAPAFSADYTLTNIGTPTGVPGLLGGIVFLNPNELLVGGNANNGSGSIYEIGVTRDGAGNITGYSGTATLYSTAPFIDGGLVFAPNGDLLYTGYPNNTIGEIKPGSTSPDKIVDLNSNGSGVASSVGSIQFAPNGQFKILSYNGGGFYTAPLTPDGSGTYDIGAATLESTPGGGPEGAFYVPPGSPDFSNPSLLLALYSAGKVEAYSVDANGNPILSTAQDFITGLGGAEGATIDPVTGDFLFSTFGSGNHIDVVSGFASPVPEPAYLPLSGALFGLMAIAAIARRKAPGTKA